MNTYKSDLWIKCSDKLPELEDSNILVLFPNGSIETVYIQDYFGDITAGVDDDGSTIYTKWYDSQKIQYWHPIPLMKDLI